MAVPSEAMVQQRRRLQPPPLGDGFVPRPRHVHRLSARFDGRVVSIVAGAGFGKTTLLSAAVAANRASPRGRDHYLALTTQDAVASRLVEAIADAVAVTKPLGRAAHTQWLFDALHGVPLGTALLFDDVQEIAEDSEGFGLLARLLTSKPEQLGIVLASRRAGALPLVRLRSQGMLDDLDERDLAFSAEELETFAARRSVAAPLLDGIAGWPALAELVARAGRTGMAEYLWQEVLEDVPPTTRRHLAVAALLGRADADLLGAAAGEAVDVAALGALPLVSTDATFVEPHGLWRDVPALQLPEEDARDARRRAGAALLARGWANEAFHHYAAARDAEGLRQAIVAVCRDGSLQVHHDQLLHWRALVPDEFTDRPEVRLLDGVIARASAPFADETVALLDGARRGFAEAGDSTGEWVSIIELGGVRRHRGEHAAVTSLVLEALSLDVPDRSDIEAVTRIGAALVLEQDDDNVGVLAELATIPAGVLTPEWQAIGEWVRGAALLQLGRPAEALAARSYAVELGGSRWLGGRLGLALARWWNGPTGPLLDELEPLDSEPQATPIDWLAAGASFGTLCAFAGRTEVAMRHVTLARRAVEEGTRPELIGALAIAEAALAVAAADEPSAAAPVRAFFAETPITSAAGMRALRRFVALVHVLLPDARDTIDALDLGPALRDCLSTAVVFESLRAGSKPDPDRLAAALSRPINALPLAWLLEMAIRLSDYDESRAGALMAALLRAYGTDVRDRLRDMRRQPELGEGARRLLAVVPVPPGRPVELRVLGPTSVAVDGAPSTAPELRRERVRQLLVFLAVKRRTLRQAVQDALWPDTAPEVARRNLRVTLTYAQRVLEPDRDPGDATFLVAQDGLELRLADEPWLAVDLDSFEHEADAAEEAERAGEHGRALARYEQACALVRGEPFADAPDADWIRPLRMRITARMVHACARAAALRFSIGDHDLAIRHASRAIELEPWAEPAYRTLAAAHLGRGDRAAARRALDECAVRLADLGVDPEPETAMLARRLGVSS
jgi:DNA-binding SARP family transcriptional activator